MEEPERKERKSRGRRKAEVAVDEFDHFVKLGMKVLGIIFAAYIGGIGLIVAGHEQYLQVKEIFTPKQKAPALRALEEKKNAEGK